MKFLKDLWNRIVSSNDEQYINKIAELENKIKSLESANEHLEDLLNVEIDKYNHMKIAFESMQKTKNELLEELESYKKVEVPYTIPTDIIDTSKIGYLPSTLIYYYNSATKKMDAKEVQVTPSKFYRIWTDEMYQFFRNKVKKCKTIDEKFITLRNSVKDIVTYKFDLSKNGLGVGENRRFPTEIFYSGIDDCEGFTSLFVTACHICDIPADRVFNATGEYKSANGMIGHSFPIVKMSDDKWWVLEATSKRKPLLLKDNKEYFIRGFLNGLSNWEISGKAKKEQF